MLRDKHTNNHAEIPSEIDIVFLWVDGNDPAWLQKKKTVDGKIHDSSEANCVGRYINNDELKYALRSIEKNAGWIRHIYIVTDNQNPEWLDVTHPKIRMVNHTDIIPSEYLPCFNAIVIEHFLYRIPGLSEKFIYSNDDMFLNKEVKPDFFFGKDGKPIVRLLLNPLGYHFNKVKELFKKNSNIYRKSIENAAMLVKSKTGKYHAGLPHHNIDGYKKSDLKYIFEQVFHKEIIATATNHIRKTTDIQRIIYSYYLLSTKKAVRKYVNRNESCRIRLQNPDYMYYITKYNPILFCLNDTQHSSDKDRERVIPFLSSLFNEKSSFEKLNAQKAKNHYTILI